jgi:hypothetical protein
VVLATTWSPGLFLRASTGFSKVAWIELPEFSWLTAAACAPLFDMLADCAALAELFESTCAPGVMLWWFAADWAVARRKFVERGSNKGPVEAFDIQIRKIEAALPEINALFRSHVVYALPSTGIYTPPEEIWKSMLDTFVASVVRLPGCVRVPYQPDRWQRTPK